MVRFSKFTFHSWPPKELTKKVEDLSTSISDADELISTYAADIKAETGRLYPSRGRLVTARPPTGSK